MKNSSLFFLYIIIPILISDYYCNKFYSYLKNFYYLIKRKGCFMKKVSFFLSLFMALLSSAFASEITLVNDSPFTLSVIVQSAGGKVLGQLVLKPSEQTNWTQRKRTQLSVEYDSNTSLTPYTVIWKCENKGYYSMCADVSPGAMITANSCPGVKFCQPKEKKKEQSSSSDVKKCPPCPTCPKCPGTKDNG
jgi:hypothetical protein